MDRGNLNILIRLYRTIKLNIKLTISFFNQKKYPLYFFILSLFFIIYVLVVRQIKSFTKVKENNFNSFPKI